MHHSNEQTIEKITQKIVREYDPEKIILFGSHAWGKPHKWSDVDLLVIKDDDRPRMERQRVVRGMIGSGTLIDVLVYTRQEIEEKVNTGRNLFLEDILRNGRVLYDRGNATISLRHTPAELVV